MGVRQALDGGAQEDRDRRVRAPVRLPGGTAARVPREGLDGGSLDPGCYFGLAAPGSITGPLRTLREPVGRLHWAGSETALRFYGGMNGAVGSGQRAAHEVINRLQSEPDVPPPTAEPIPTVPSRGRSRAARVRAYGFCAGRIPPTRVRSGRANSWSGTRHSGPARRASVKSHPTGGTAP